MKSSKIKMRESSCYFNHHNHHDHYWNTNSNPNPNKSKVTYSAKQVVLTFSLLTFSSPKVGFIIIKIMRMNDCCEYKIACASYTHTSSSFAFSYRNNTRLLLDWVVNSFNFLCILCCSSLVFILLEKTLCSVSNNPDL